MKIFVLCALLFSAALQAADSGLYTDETRYGEGITLIRTGDVVQFFLFTYEPSTDCWNFLNLPEVTDWDEHTCHEQRWFLTGGDELIGDTVTGFLFSTVGIDYPDGGVDPDDPFVSIVGEDFVVGLYVLKRQGDGWRMVVFPVGNLLDVDDPLYNTTFNFNQVVLEASEPEVAN